MELKGNCVLTPIYPTNFRQRRQCKKCSLVLDKMHKEKIKMSDAILVVNVGDYIGNRVCEIFK